jgi:hypothetical protein
MKDCYESFAVGASFAAAHYDFLPAFVPFASGTSASVRAHLENRTIHLGWKDSSRGHGYGFYFVNDPLVPPRPSRREMNEAVFMNVRKHLPNSFTRPFSTLRWALRLCFPTLFILFIFTLTFEGIDRNGTGGTSLQTASSVALFTTMASLLVAAITKSVWKVVERETRTLWIFRSLHTVSEDRQINSVSQSSDDSCYYLKNFPRS